jgi:hypothetical protein
MAAKIKTLFRLILSNQDIVKINMVQLQNQSGHSFFYDKDLLQKAK